MVAEIPARSLVKGGGLVRRMPGEERVGVNRAECSDCRTWQQTLMGEERSLCGTQMAVCVPSQGMWTETESQNLSAEVCEWFGLGNSNFQRNHFALLFSY